jgi:hypothetical protein
VRCARRALEERGELAPRSSPRSFFERIAPGEHQGHYRAGEFLADRQRARHGEQRDDIDTGVAAQQGARDRPAQRHQRDDDGAGPNELSGIREAGRRQRTAGQESTQQKPGQQARRGLHGCRT